MGDTTELETRCRAFREKVLQVKEAVSSVIIGQAAVVDRLLVGILAGGHVLIEGVPGLGKTLLVKALARTMGLSFRRVQFTPDLLPSDILGARTLVEGEDGTREILFQPGPVFTNILLADEINRSGPKTQSALLEAMEERQVTSGGETYPIEDPFMVLATHNPLEQEGTYPLPEAQLDRFLLKLKIGLPDRDALMKILDLSPGERLASLPELLTRADVLEGRGLAAMIPVAEEFKGKVADLLIESQPGSPAVAGRVRLGLSPRAGQALVATARVRALLLGRYNVSLEDLDAMVEPVCEHRLQLSFSAQADGLRPGDLLKELASRAGLRKKR